MAGPSLFKLFAGLHLVQLVWALPQSRSFYSNTDQKLYFPQTMLLQPPFLGTTPDTVPASSLNYSSQFRPTWLCYSMQQVHCRPLLTTPRLDDPAFSMLPDRPRTVTHSSPRTYRPELQVTTPTSVSSAGSNLWPFLQMPNSEQTQTFQRTWSPARSTTFAPTSYPDYSRWRSSTSLASTPSPQSRDASRIYPDSRSFKLFPDAPHLSSDSRHSDYDSQGKYVFEERSQGVGEEQVFSTARSIRPSIFRDMSDRQPVFEGSWNYVSSSAPSVLAGREQQVFSTPHSTRPTLSTVSFADQPRFNPVSSTEQSIFTASGRKLNIPISDFYQRGFNRSIISYHPAYTVYGEACADECAPRGYSYSWCSKVNRSQVGTWADTDYCTPTAGITTYGDECKDECAQRGEKYYWCHKVTTLWSYCTPVHLLRQAEKWRELHPEGIATAFTVRGERCQNGCDRHGYSYTWCNRGKPNPSGGWANSDYCTTEAGVTSDGERCIDECDFRGYTYSWCNTASSWGYCTHPSFFSYKNSSNPFSPLWTEPRTAIRNTVRTFNSSLVLPDHNMEAKGFTVFGESCADECSNHGSYAYTWCHKIQASPKGTWQDSDYCTNDSGITAYGEQCADECAQRGQQYYWCHKVTSLWGYCTPQFLINSLRQG